MNALDLNPIVLAVAGLILACTPAAVGYLTVQVQVIKAKLDAQTAQAGADRSAVVARLDKLEGTVRGTAAATQEVVKKVGGNGA